MLLNKLTRWKYELLLCALILHLFIGVFIPDLSVYTRGVWLMNILLVGVASIGVFVEKGKWKKRIRNALFILVLVLPAGISFFSGIQLYEQVLNLTYVVFFLYIFIEILKFLVKPGYVNTDIISAAGCGYFLLIEMAIFLFQFFIRSNHASFKGIDLSHYTTIFTDLVYFCSITLTSIGFGDITPATHSTKLVASMFGIIGQFYSVVLLGILIGKFTSRPGQA